MSTQTPDPLRQLMRELEQRLVDEGCVGDDEQGCTRDDDDIPIEEWCVNCLASRLLRSAILRVPPQEEQKKDEEGLRASDQSSAADRLDLPRKTQPEVAAAAKRTDNEYR